MVGFFIVFPVLWIKDPRFKDRSSETHGNKGPKELLRSLIRKESLFDS